MLHALTEHIQLRSLGVETIYKDKTVILKKNGKSVERLDYDFINQPDLAQTFVVTCAFCVEMSLSP